MVFALNPIPSQVLRDVSTAETINISIVIIIP